ncbi:MAG: DUF4411 family protein [Boseongicola sp. SB0664_bin_43]|uniref:DUF4411 family protein n=1 Tax=Boseongicola sp. SB0664_bin_43 TaxID=2604844 RepID=A0A6B0Y1T5_9RHOB|nr:DUF4411 family protein [Boseongicola sp. SB0664_bin_43]MYK32074.1 DUF4411 family protein [Boseongicola sp. SB0670_bin_30]
MAAEDHYSIDTSAFLDWWVRYYPPSAFMGLVPRAKQLIEEGRLRASREVRDELEVRNDPCFRWVKDQPGLFVDSDVQIQSFVTKLMGQYFDAAKPDKGISGADPFVIGLAAVQNPTPWVVVTGEKPGSIENPKIPFVCRHLQPQPIRTIGFLELIVEEGWQLS